MRIVIDMQGAQAKHAPQARANSTLSLVRSIVEHKGHHEIILALSGLLPNTIEHIRAEFLNLIPQKDIRIWYAPTLDTANRSLNIGIAQKIREAFLSSLRPDCILAPLFHPEFDIEQGVFSIGVFSRDMPTVALIDVSSDLLADAHSRESIAAFYQKAQIQDAHSILISTAIAAEHREELLGILPEGLLTCIDTLITPSHDRQETSAERVIALLEHLQEERQTTLTVGAAPKAKLAYLSPFHPERSGISDYTDELLPSLAQYYDICVITELPTVGNEWIRSNCEIHTTQEFIAHSERYDRVLYHFGNSHFHAHMFDLLEQCPGVVVLHDFYLGDVQRYREAHNIPTHAWTRSLYESHGYRAVRRRFLAHEQDSVGRDYPANFQVLHDALGVITHSEFSRRLSDQWYGKDVAQDSAIIPLLRVPSAANDREFSRKTLGLAEDEFIITSFGFLGPTKLNQNLMDAWLHSKLAEDEKCILVFVGENSASEYSLALEKAIKSSGLPHRIRITGWTDTDTYRHYLASSDISVQLRGNSRGETSAAVLDCMNHSIATIVNATGAMAELPADAVWMLPSKFTLDQLVEALETLYENQVQRESLGYAAAGYIRAHHSPSHCATQYRNAIEHYYAIFRNGEDALVQAIAESINPHDLERELPAIASCIDKSIADLRPGITLFVDISTTCKTQLHTGIERVARALTIALIENDPESYRIEPVCLEKINGHWVYVYARDFTTTLLGMPKGLFGNAVAQPRNGDIVLGLDISGDRLTQAVSDGFIESLRNEGVRVYFMVYDLLPITLPHTFPPGASVSHARWLSAVAKTDGAICISEAVADDLRKWIRHNGTHDGRPFFIGVSHLGADVVNSAPTTGIPADASSALVAFSRCPTFVMVGTIEPRKGYLQVLDAFTHLWNEGVDVNLVIVGNEGWKGLPDEMRRTIPETVHRLSTHVEHGKHLFWLQGASDEYLEKIYEHSNCLIAASEGEGFGLPLIEGAQHQLPMVARDIPVFREVAGDHAYYFSAGSGKQLADHVKQWLSLYREGCHPSVENMRWLTWKDSAANVFSLCTRTATDQATVKHSPRLLVDISVVYKNDFRTGIQRVVRSVLGCLLGEKLQSYKITPVFLDYGNGRWCYKSAVVYFDGHDVTFDAGFTQATAEIVPQQGDILLGLDLAGGYVVNAAREGLYTQFRAAGARVYFVVYDLLPVTMPQFFSLNDSAGHEAWLKAIAHSDGVICISEATADDFRRWAASQKGDEQVDPAFQIRSFHLGADIGNSSPTVGMPESAETVLAKLAALPTFLMVGTVEPRKGHPQVLDAFESLWSSNMEVNLVIVGKKGWMTDAFCERLRNHTEVDSHLFWLEGVSDEYLDHIYAASTCLIAASEGEGFGLPLIEAAQHGLPIIARDIPVFREVAGEHAFYFNGENPTDLTRAITDWLYLHVAAQSPKSDNMPWLTWNQSAVQLMQSCKLCSSRRHS